jgi:ankyrin repeat protein
VPRRLLLAVLALGALAGCGSDGEERRPGSPDLDRRLIAAAFANDVDRARDLIRQGADVNAKDDTQQSAYLIAASEVGDDPRLLELTLANGAKVDDKDRFDGTGLIRAAERGHARIVGRLLETDIDRDHVNRVGWTALLEAIVLGHGGPRHVRTVQALVDGGVDVNAPDSDGVTPLAHAEERGQREIAGILRAAGARRSPA